MEDILVLGLAAIGSISVFWALTIILPLLVGAAFGAIGCGTIGIIIGLIFLRESLTDVAVTCVVIGLVGGAIHTLQVMLKTKYSEFSEYVYSEDNPFVTMVMISDSVIGGIKSIIAVVFGRYVYVNFKTYGDSYFTEVNQISSFIFDITLIVAGTIGAYFAFATSEGNALIVIAGYGAGTIVGIVGWMLFGGRLVTRLVESWYLSQD